MDDHHEGPFSPDEIFKQQQTGKVSADSYVWCEGMPDWVMLEQVAELKSALAQFKDPVPSAPKPQPTINLNLNPGPAGGVAATPQPSMTKTQSTAAVSQHTPSMTETIAPAPASGRQTSKARSALTMILGGIVTILLVGIAALAVLSRTTTEETHSLIRPTLVKILDIVPALQPIFKLTPKIPDIKADDSVDLEVAMMGAPEVGVKLAIAVSQGDPNRPYFYVATNLPDKTKFDIYLVGNGETLLNRLAFSTQTTVMTKFGLGKSDVILAVGGQPIPKGEYDVYVVESTDQDESVRAAMNDFQPTRAAVKTPSEVPAQTKYLFVKKMFIGGERDENYLTRLKSFHEKVKSSTDREVQELKQYSDTLSIQFASFTGDFRRVTASKKPTAQVKGLWDKSVSTWQQLNGQLDQTVQTWTKETLQNEFFYGKTYELVKNAYEAVKKLFAIEIQFVTQPSDKAAFEIQHGKALSETRDSLEILKTKVDQILKAPKTPSGLPTREGQ